MVLDNTSCKSALFVFSFLFVKNDKVVISDPLLKSEGDNKDSWISLQICLKKSVCYTESLAIFDFQRWTTRLKMGPESTLFTFLENVLRPHFEEVSAEGPHLPLYRELSQCNPARDSNIALKASVTPSHLLAADCFLRERNFVEAPCLIRDRWDQLTDIH